MTQNKGNSGRRGDARPGRGDRGDSAQGRSRPNQGGDRGQGGRGRVEERGAPEIEFVLVTQQGCAALPVSDNHLPAAWHRIPDSPFFKPGLYLKGGGGLSKVRGDVRVDGAVLIAAWEDPDFPWPVGGGRTAQIGQHALLLVRSEASDGPPWLPLWAGLKGDASDFTDGIFSGWPDPERPTRYDAEFVLDREKVTVRHTRPVRDDDGTAALVESLRWLAAHPDDRSPGAEALRAALVHGGHGIQRLGLALAWEDRAVALGLAREILVPLCPDAAALLLGVATFFGAASADEARVAFLDVVQRIGAVLRPGARQQFARTDLAVVATWMHGLFGLRPDRENAQPARALLLACRLARGFWNHADLLAHPDAPVPSSPLSPADLQRASHDLAVPRWRESDLELVVRCLAIAEAAQELRQPRLEHLGSLRAGWETLVGYPVAGRAFAGRHDYLLSLASFRRLDGRDGALEPFHLVIEQPSVASSRAYGRLLGNGSDVAASLPAMLQASPSAVARQLGEALALEADTIEDRLHEVADQRCTPIRLNVAGALLERLVASSEAGRGAPSRPIPVPAPLTEPSVRAHYLFWRQFCRSLIPSQAEGYEAFLAEWLPRIDTLPGKLQRELYALARTWLRLDPTHADRAEPVRQAVVRHLGQIDGSEGTWDALRGELGELLFTLAAELDPETCVASLERLAATPDWGLRDVARLLEVIRRSPAGRVLASSDFFRTLHRLLAQDPSPHALLGRAEWLRLALQPARRMSAVQWLLDGRRNGAFLATDGFRDFFADDAPRAIEHPDDALVRLLELALAHAPAELEDELASAVARATRWAPESTAATLRDAGRYHAAASVLLRGRAGTRSDAVDVARHALRAARDGASLLRAAESVVALRTLWADLDDEIVAEAATAFSAWEPSHRLADGAQQGFDAWRLVHAVDTVLVPEHLLDAAVRIAALQRHAPSALAFVEEALLREVLAAIPPLDGSSTPTTLPLQSAVLPRWERAAKESQQPVRFTSAKLVARATRAAADLRILAAVEDGLRDHTLDATRALLAGWTESGPADDADTEATDEAPTDEAPNAEAPSHEDGAAEDVQAPAADEEPATDAATDDDAPAAETTTSSRPASGRGRRGQPRADATALTPSWAAAAHRTLPLLDAWEPDGGRSLHAALRVLQSRDQSGFPLTSHVLGIAESMVRAAGGRLHGERTLRRGAHLRIDLSPARWALLLQLLVRAIQHAGLAPRVTLDDKKLTLVLSTVSVEDGSTEESDEAPERRDDDTAEAADLDGAETEESDEAEESTEAEQLPLLVRLAALAQGRHPADDSLFGSALDAQIFQRVCAEMPTVSLRAHASGSLLRIDPRAQRRSAGGGSGGGGGGGGGRRRRGGGGEGR